MVRSRDAGGTVSLPAKARFKERPRTGKLTEEKKRSDEILSDDPSPSGVLISMDKSDRGDLERKLDDFKSRVLKGKIKGNGLKGVSRDTENYIRGVANEKLIMKAFELVRKDADRVSVFYDQKEQKFVSVKSLSRWSSNPEKYQRKVKRYLEEQTRGLRSLTMVTLTFDRGRVREMPEFSKWPVQSEEGLEIFIIRYLSDYLGAFLDRLKKYRKRKKLKWNFVSWSFELWNKAGEFHPHIHIIFFGGYVAPLDVLKDYWTHSDPNQVDVKPMRNNNVAGYIVKYVGKGLDRLCRAGYEKYAAFIWYFKRRLYAVRPCFRKVGCNTEKRCLLFVGYALDGGKVKLSKAFKEAFNPSEEIVSFEDLPELMKTGT
jgi:hypothetical protein